MLSFSLFSSTASCFLNFGTSYSWGSRSLRYCSGMVVPWATVLLEVLLDTIEHLTLLWPWCFFLLAFIISKYILTGAPQTSDWFSNPDGLGYILWWSWLEAPGINYFLTKSTLVTHPLPKPCHLPAMQHQKWLKNMTKHCEHPKSNHSLTFRMPCKEWCSAQHGEDFRQFSQPQNSPMR